jgi:hypothetical protein
MLWRLRRKWRHHGPALLDEARKRSATQRHVASVPMLGGLAGSIALEFMRTAQLQELQDALTRSARAFEEATRPLRLQSEMIGRGLDEMLRPSRALEETVRAIRGW